MADLMIERASTRFDTMDPQQALTIKAHLELLQERLKSLTIELQAASREQCDINRELESHRSRAETIKQDYAKRGEELEASYQQEITECKRQIKLAEDMMEKKREERKSLLEYLNESSFCEQSVEDLKDFDWDKLKKLEMRPPQRNHVSHQKRKSLVLTKLVEQGKARVSELNQLIHQTIPDKDRIERKIDETREQLDIWMQMAENQERHISKMKVENDRLNLLIKQCTITNEPMSEFVTKNVREKCQSFLDSSSPEELLSGLTRYKNRQSRMIKLLKHKDDKLGSDLSVLQIATDQTVDLMQYYLDIVQTKRDLVLN